MNPPAEGSALKDKQGIILSEVEEGGGEGLRVIMAKDVSSALYFLIF